MSQVEATSAASLTRAGLSHTRVGRDSDDRSLLASGMSEVDLMLAVADGAGSLTRSGDGAAIAVRAAADYFADLELAESHEIGRQIVNGSSVSIPLAPLGLDLHDAMRLAAIEAAGAVRSESGYREMGSTLTFAVFTDQHVGLMSIGDSFGVVAINEDGDSRFELVRAPQFGEYANQTRLLTSAEFEILTAVYSIEDVSAVALCSDAFEHASVKGEAPHSPFWSSIFKMHREGNLNISELFDTLENNALTDDDLSMAIAHTK